MVNAEDINLEDYSKETMELMGITEVKPGTYRIGTDCGAGNDRSYIMYTGYLGAKSYIASLLNTLKDTYQ